jgi:hypothetical protein
MTGTMRRAALALVGAVAGAVLSLALTPHHHAPASTPDDPPPMGWTEACTPAAIALVCRTYPPGDDRWQPSPPVPPQPPLPTPWPGGESAR